MNLSDIKVGTVYEDARRRASVYVWLVLEVLEREEDCVVIRELTLHGKHAGAVNDVTLPYYLLDGFDLVVEGA